MATSKSSKKRIRQNAKHRTRNQVVKSGLRTTLKKMKAKITAGDAEGAASLQPSVQKALDTAVSKGVIHKGTARRHKSRIATKINQAKG